MTVYDYEVTELLSETTYPLSRYAGKVLLIVNTASKCGFTPQFEGLERLAQDYADRGLMVLGFPCNQFMNQDPGSADEIGAFCQKNYGVTFPMHQKIAVNGADTHPLYAFLQAAAPGVLGSEAVKWNFTKFLVGRAGDVVGRYAPSDEPDSLRPAIEAELAK